MQITEKISSQFNSWTGVMAPFIESEAFDSIFSFLKHQSKVLNKTIIPASGDIFSSFTKCDRNQLRAIIILMDPYPTVKDSVMVADGIPLSCKNTGQLQPSLHTWYWGLEATYGFHPDNDLRADTSYLLEEEHVLLLNSSLSTEKDKPGSHVAIWLPFMQHLIESVINVYYKGLPIVLCGAQSQKLEKFINPMLHYILKVEHPAASSYSGKPWKFNDMFNFINGILKSNNGPKHQINWLREKTPIQSLRGNYKVDETKINEEKCKDLPFN